MTGVATLRVAKVRSEIPFAAIPLLFGIQQITEGVIWLTFRHEAPLLKQAMTFVYSTFSHVLWPIYVPFAIGVMESARWRRRSIAALQIAGLTVGLYLLHSIVARPLVAQVVNMHIVYASPHFYLVPVMVLYLAASCVSCFFSSHKFINLFGFLLLFSFIAAYLAHALALVSIWCFIAALLSILVYAHLRYRNLGGSSG